MSTLPAAPATAAPAAAPAATPPSPGLPAALHAVGWLVRDTFRQAVATGILPLVLAVTGLCVLGCLSVGVTGGELTLAFGAVRLPVNHDPADSVRFVQVVLALGVADGLGLLLILVWTAGFLPAFLDPAAAAVMLAKPVPRWSLLAGKYLGVLAFVAVNAVLFVGGTWLALGLRTGVWDAAYFWCVPLLLAHFAVFFSVSTLLAVATRSPVACVFGSVLFWLLCWGMNYGRHAALAVAGLDNAAGHFLWTLEVGYWVLPKPADLGVVLVDALDAGRYFGPMAEMRAVQEKGAFHPALSLLSSLLFGAVMLALSAYEFVTADY